MALVKHNITFDNVVVNSLEHLLRFVQNGVKMEEKIWSKLLYLS